MAKIIVLMGAPGAGKGTQARLLHERLHLPQISTGDMFRALKEAQTPLAAEVRTLMAAGQLVPDDVTIRVVQERTAQDDCRDGYILDGFPRTVPQAMGALRYSKLPSTRLRPACSSGGAPRSPLPPPSSWRR